MRYDVHLYAVVRVKVSGVEAGSQAEAISAAESRVRGDDLFPHRIHLGAHGIIATEFADEFTGEALVDEEGDPEYQRSDWYWFDEESGRYRPSSEAKPQPDRRVAKP